MSVRDAAKPRPLGVNLTPMIDIVFLLIVFFLLTAQLSSQRLTELSLPRTATEQDSRSSDTPGVINVVPHAEVESAGGDYRLGTRVFSASTFGLQQLEMELRGLRARTPDAVIVVRADRSEDSQRVVVALRAASRAGIERVEVAVISPGASTDEPS